MVSKPKVTGIGSYLCVEFDIILLFGMTEFKAQLAWKEDVSGLMLFNLTSIGLTLLMVLGKRGTVSFKEKKLFRN